MVWTDKLDSFWVTSVSGADPTISPLSVLSCLRLRLGFGFLILIPTLIPALRPSILQFS